MSNLISHLERQAISSYHGTSFSPERRGKDFIESYGNELEEDIQFLKEKQVSSESIDWYKSKYINFISALINSRSRILSPMITGPARFPSERNRKRIQQEMNQYDRFVDWRERALRILPKRAEPRKTHSTELERYQNELSQLQQLQDLMKKVNAAYSKWLRKKESVTAEQFQQLHKLSDREFKLIVTHEPAYNTKTKVFPSFQLTNNNANIKRIKLRIQEVSVKQKKAERPAEQNRHEFPGGHVQVDYEFDRIKIFHDQRPDPSVISDLKSNGFHWSRNLGCWMRKITSAAIYRCNLVLNINVPY